MHDDTETPDLQNTARTLAAIGFGPPLAHDQHPDVPLSWLGAHLRAAAAGPDPIPSLVQGMRTFLTALSRGDLHQASPDLLANLQDAVEPVFHRLVSLAPRGVPPHSVALGLGALRSLVANLHRHAAVGPIDLSDPLVAEEVNHVGLLTSELDASERRRRLNESGNQVARLAAINVARNRTDTAGLPLH